MTMPTRKPALPPIGKYIDLLTDFGFKRVFGSEPNKDLLIDLLNSIFEGRKLLLIWYTTSKSIPVRYGKMVRPYLILPARVMMGNASS